jgi:ureidoacrylate peracid hydrolase
MVELSLDPVRTALVIVDMQNCFVADSPVAAPLGAEVAGRLNRLAAACRRSGIPVIWTRHVVRPDGSNVGLLGERIPAVADGIINEDAPAAALHELVDVQSPDIVVNKARFGAFYGTELELILRSLGIDTILLGGINTNVCVDTTAREAAVLEFRALFLSDGTANFDLPDGDLGAVSAEELQRAAVAVMQFGFADVVTVGDALGRIPTRRPRTKRLELSARLSVPERSTAARLVNAVPR